jgi:hypothetical protein
MHMSSQAFLARSVLVVLAIAAFAGLVFVFADRLDLGAAFAVATGVVVVSVGFVAALVWALNNMDAV